MTARTSFFLTFPHNHKDRTQKCQGIIFCHFQLIPVKMSTNSSMWPQYQNVRVYIQQCHKSAWNQAVFKRWKLAIFWKDLWFWIPFDRLIQLITIYDLNIYYLLISNLIFQTQTLKISLVLNTKSKKLPSSLERDQHRLLFYYIIFLKWYVRSNLLLRMIEPCLFWKNPDDVELGRASRTFYSVECEWFFGSARPW